MPELDQCVLRPMTDEDLGLVLAWRNSDRVRSHMFTTHEISWEEHRAWWGRKGDDPSERHYVFEVGGLPVGVVNVVNIQPNEGTASWGYYIGAADAPPGSGSAMGFLAMEKIFGDLGIRGLSGEVLASNTASLKLHRKLGFVEEGLVQMGASLDSNQGKIMRLGLTATNWACVSHDLAQLIFRG